MTHIQDEHIIEAVGKCEVTIQNGVVTKVGKATINDCPLAKRFAVPVAEMSPEAVKANIEMRIKTFGMCTPDRDIYSDEPFVGFGASEIISSAFKDKGNGALIDSAVLACDGAGTVIVTDPRMVQGIGGKMSGLVKTVPYASVIERIIKGGGYVLNPDTAEMDPVKGVLLALQNGFSRPAVTVVSGDAAQHIREICKDAYIIGVHSTGLSEEDVQKLAASVDLMTACASKAIREVCGSQALLQAGSGIPVFALTQNGKEMLLVRMSDIKQPLLVTSATLPVYGNGPDPLI